MSSYFIAQITIHDPDGYARYEGDFDGIFEKYDGEVVVVDDAPVVLEGQWTHKRVVVIRFRDEEEARRWYDSPEYQALARIRQRASTSDIILAHGRS